MKKTLTLVLSLALAVAIGIGGTLAWLTAQTSTITNTFTVGQVDITLQEKEIGKNTFLDAETEAKAQTYKVSPGVNIEKEAKVVVKANSEACYLFVKVVKGNSFDANFAYTIAAGWTELTEGSGIYYRMWMQPLRMYLMKFLQRIPLLLRTALLHWMQMPPCLSRPTPSSLLALRELRARLPFRSLGKRFPLLN
jgi:predicted ribosomally synthesized peptide with SipW-like signal peptide